MLLSYIVTLFCGRNFFHIYLNDILLALLVLQFYFNLDPYAFAIKMPVLKPPRAMCTAVHHFRQINCHDNCDACIFMLFFQ